MKTTVPTQTTSLPGNVYRKCSEMMLSAFIDAYVNNNHARVIKYGKVPPALVEEAWRNIYFEFCDLSDTKSYKTLFALSKEIGMLTNRRNGVRVCLKVLSVSYIPYCETYLQNLGYNCHLDPKNPEQYAKILASIQTKAKSIDIALAEREHELQAELEGKDTQETTEADFERNLAELGKYMSSIIHANEITVSEYCAIRRKYDAECEAMEKLNNRK